MKAIIFSKKLLFGSMAGILLVLSCASILWSADTEKSVDRHFPRALHIGMREYVLEIADTDTKRERGLGGRESLCAECGMLFVFEKPGRYAFWMKDMRFPLDIIWLSGETVVFIARDVQADFSGIIDPAVSADRVLEVNAGRAESLDTGETVRFSD